jgi:beta-lactamase class A
MLSFSVGYALSDVHATDRTLKPAASISTPSPTAGVVASPTASPAADTPAPPAPDPTPPPAPVHPTFGPLAATIQAITAASGSPVSVSLIELGGPAPSNWDAGGSVVMNAASTYKLPALMEEAQLVAAGKLDPAGQVCYQDGDWEDGWYDDYATGMCYSRAELADRAAHFSDNTAGHMLVRDLGGGAALNSYAAALGALNSSFFDGNETTAGDLAHLLAAEANGSAGGAQAQAWLYPKLTHTRYEAGIPAGVPGGVTVVHKTGELDGEVNDAAIISGGKGGMYVLAVMTNGPGGDSGWSLVAQISAAVWAYESAR